MPRHGIPYAGMPADSPPRTTRRMHFAGDGATIADNYVDGISITHGSTYQHVFTYALTNRSATTPPTDVQVMAGLPHHHSLVQLPMRYLQSVGFR